MKKVVYITGYLGFIGSYVTRACLDKGWYVRGIDKETYAANTSLLQSFYTDYSDDNFYHERKDINDIPFLYDCDYIINLAAETHVGNSIANSEDFIHSNIDGVHHLLELIKHSRTENGKKPVLIHFSTDEVYGDIAKGVHTESDLLCPSNPYSATKAAADMLILAWARTYDIPYIIVRPTNNYGIGQYVEKLIPKTCKYLHLGRKIPLHANGSPTRNWLHAEDTAEAIIKIIEFGATNEIYNICGDFEQSNLETVKKILIHYGIDLHKNDIEDYVDFSYNRPGQDLRYALDDSKIRSIGWAPKRSFDTEIERIVKFYKDKFIW